MNNIEEDILKGVELIKQGKLVAFPTETVYGLGADAKNDRAVISIYTAKGRPSFNPLIIHVPDLEEAKKYGEFDEKAITLANAFWPGPMTLVVKRKSESKISYMVTSGLDTIAIRVPSNETASKFLKACRTPIAAPSANASGKVSSTNPDHVKDSLGSKVSFIIKGKPSEFGLESTIILCTTNTAIILRPGAITLEQIAKVVPNVEPYNSEKFINTNNKPMAPGQLKSHYSPKIPLVMNVTKPIDDYAILGFGKIDNIDVDLNLSESGDLIEAARNLFDYIRKLDTFPYKGICVTPIPNYEIGVAINDRLTRAEIKDK